VGSALVLHSQTPSHLSTVYSPYIGGTGSSCEAIKNFTDKESQIEGEIHVFALFIISFILKA